MPWWGWLATGFGCWAAVSVAAGLFWGAFIRAGGGGGH